MHVQHKLVVSLHNQRGGAGAAGADRFYPQPETKLTPPGHFTRSRSRVIVARSRSRSRPNVVRLRITLQNLAGMPSRGHRSWLCWWPKCAGWAEPNVPTGSAKHILPEAGVGATFSSERSRSRRTDSFPEAEPELEPSQICTALVGAARADRSPEPEVGLGGRGRRSEPCFPACPVLFWAWQELYFIN